MFEVCSEADTAQYSHPLVFITLHWFVCLGIFYFPAARKMEELTWVLQGRSQVNMTDTQIDVVSI